MIIGFCTENKYTDAAAVYEQMSEMAGGNAGNHLKMIEVANENVKYDIVIADSVDKAREMGVVKSDAKMFVVFDGKRHATADMLFVPSKAHKTHYVKKYDWTADRVYVVGRPCMDLLWGTDEEKELLTRVFLRSRWVDWERETVLFQLKDSTIGRDMWDEIVEWSDGELNIVIRSTEDQPINEEHLAEGSNVTIDEFDDPLPRLLSANILVTDYDDLMLDYLTLDRPIVLLHHRLENWWFEDLDYSPGPTVSTPEKVIHALTNRDKFPQKYVDARHAWRRKFVGGKGDSAIKAVKLITKKWGEL